MPERNELREAQEALQKELGLCADRFTHECKLNQRWDLGLTAAAIVFTLLTAVTGTLEDGSLLPGKYQKILTGVFGAISVAIQSAVTKFPVQERARSYRRLRNEMYILQQDLQGLDEAKAGEDLKTIRSQYTKMLRDEVEMP
ncbi:hypothetical protein Cri9333_1073 [Crinalium epipsammum PCC 9333]|uniref:Uncharacterized protein n=1 Tax=Crinalium epipsammum PCC 9333 TaxID=1173022 RepID=K9VVI3_9CYAN|nr:hypothetical protein [Crinalium epipsammum]AFZ11986.1 hypothetical protein Cri9333_1073 [Crinalium epipsammum PCC 9333]